MHTFPAYNEWKEEQLDEKYVGAIFSMLSEKGKVLPTFPIEYVRKGLPQKTMKVGMARSDIFDSFESFESFFY